MRVNVIFIYSRRFNARSNRRLAGVRTHHAQGSTCTRFCANRCRYRIGDSWFVRSMETRWMNRTEAASAEASREAVAPAMPIRPLLHSTVACVIAIALLPTVLFANIARLSFRACVLAFPIVSLMVSTVGKAQTSLFGGRACPRIQENEVSRATLRCFI